MSIEEKILKYLYDSFPDIKFFTSGIIPPEELGLDPQQDALEFEKIFDLLIDNYYIDRDGIQISYTFQGIFYYEEKYLRPNYYYVKAIRIILEFLEKLENGEYKDNSIQNSEIIEELEKEGISMKNREFYQFLTALDHKTDFFKNIGPFGIKAQDTINLSTRSKTILTPIAREFLNSWRYESKLFGKIVNPLQKKILHEEYDELQKLIQQGSWKDACIKMGGILEYLLTLWLQDKDIAPSEITGNIKTKKWKVVSFHNMIKFYMNNSMNYSDEIGNYTDWNLVKNILKDYRNYVHLLKYEDRARKGDFLRKEEFDRVYPIFQKILKKF